ncbi:YbhB/YbcL family Raf kinase inhibitor-like protein [Agaribacter flavus]|uniref:YbhB/YbcL family Raf kinase inhibitor-like protein n=1 Tax=Agaribacter flavus TaxID=1902781 RepID=A0ABV7FKA6_9ALTE
MQLSKKLFFIVSMTAALSANAGSFSVSSEDIAHGEFMGKKHEFSGFGCTGDDKSPQLSWSNAPEGTKSFAVTVYDPDAPTGSGWWHWQVINIPSTVTTLKTGAGNVKKNALPEGAAQVVNDYGIAGYGGACPPKGHGAHRYFFTVYALSVEKLELPEGASGALAGYMIKANTIESSTIQALYKR